MLLCATLRFSLCLREKNIYCYTIHDPKLLINTYSELLRKWIGKLSLGMSKVAARYFVLGFLKTIFLKEVKI